MTVYFDNFKSISLALKYHSVHSSNKVYLVCDSKEYTFFDVNEKVNKVCSYLERYNIRKGDIVSIIIKNSLDYVILYLACLRLGSPINPYPFNLEPHEVLRYVNNLNPKLMICQKEHYDSIANKTDFKTLLWTNDYLNEDKKEYDDFIPNDIDSAAIYYSSGTTGNPKSIVFSHKNMMSNISSIVRGFKFTSSDVHLIILPLGHTASINYSFLPGTLIGSKLIIAESYWKIRARFWEFLISNEVSYIEVVPSVLVAIANTPYDPLTIKKNKRLQYVGCGSAPLPIELQLEFNDKFKIKIANLYGLSETGPTHIDYPLDDNWTSGSIGYPLDVNQVFILDEEGNKLGPNETGEIAIKGDNVFTSYYNNKKLYDSVVNNNIFYTGDLGHYDDSGKYFFEGRKKDLIIKGGINILPEEIDEVLFMIEEVMESATVGIMDTYLGEKIESFIVLKQGSTLDSDQVKRHCRRFLSREKIPDSIVFIDSLPKGPSGKILRKELRH